jgi:uncharacterized protein YdeI (BOF family)
MRAFVAAVIALVVPFAVSAMGSKEQAFGEGVTGADRVKIAELNAHPDGYVGQTVRVEGTISKVAGKHVNWVELTDEGGTIRVNVDGKKLSFPESLKGKRVAVQGVFEKRTVAGEADFGRPLDRDGIARTAEHGKAAAKDAEHGAAEAARAVEHGKAAVEKGEHGRSEAAQAAEHGKSAVEKGEHGRSEYAHAEEHGKSELAKAEHEDREEPGEAHEGAKPARERAPDSVVYEIQGTGAMLL